MQKRQIAPRYGIVGACLLTALAGLSCGQAPAAPTLGEASPNAEATPVETTPPSNQSAVAATSGRAGTATAGTSGSPASQAGGAPDASGISGSAAPATPQASAGEGAATRTGAAGATAGSAGSAGAPNMQTMPTMQTTQPSGRDEDLDAEQLTAALRIGWNLGNSLDAVGGETAWGNPMVTPALLDAVAAAGFGAVRIPVTWVTHFGPGPTFAIDASWLARVEEVVGYVLDAGMVAIINVHHDGAEGGDGEWLSLRAGTGQPSADHDAAVKAQFVALWQQIADHFVAQGPRLLFESMNEIKVGYGKPDPVYYKTINALNQAFVDTVRDSGGNNATRCLIVPGYNTNIEYTLEGFEAPKDAAPKRLILSVHYYDPWSFAGSGETHAWGAGSPGADTWGQEDWVIQQFESLKLKYGDAGLPVIIGEYGAVHQAGAQDYRRYYMEYVTKAAVDRGIVPIYWDNGGNNSGNDGFGLFDRTTAQSLHPEVLQAMLRAATEDYPISAVAKPR